MGLLYVAASLEQAGHQVTVRDLSIPGEELSTQELKHADVVGISSDTTRIERALSIASRAAAAGAKVVMGGPHPQFTPDEILGSGRVTAIIKGEGEPVFPALLDALERGENLGGVNGLIYREGLRCIETANATPPDVEQLPWPARHLVDLRRYSGSVHGVAVTPLVSSRGCPGACTFCSSSRFFGRGWRFRSAESVLAEIDEIYVRYGFRAISFLDDNFTLQPERAEQIADGIIERGYSLNLWNFSRVDTITRNPRMVDKLARAGTKTVYLGIESDNSESLSSMGKKTTSADAELAVRMLQSNGIEAFGSFIIGNLNEDRKQVDQTIQMAIRLNTNIAQFSILTPYPGTELFEQIKDRIFTRRWKFYDGLHLVFRHPRINRHLLQVMLISAFVRFYRRSQKARDGFKNAASRQRPTLRQAVVCIKDMFF
jgi:anaerobic magnesium-protoporphyrin IX monomethyl ester cyclase